MNSSRFCLLLGTAILICAPAASSGIMLGQIDTFEDGTAQGWTNAFIGTPHSGGPAGSGDHFLDIASGFSGLDPREQARNTSQWQGNYLAAGVTGVEMDLKNLLPAPTTTLHVRIAITQDPSLTNLTNVGYASTVPFDLPGDGLWHHAIFSLASADMTGVGLLPPQPLSTDLANVVTFRILSSVLPSTEGDFITGAAMGVDNIHAIPEPTSISILLSGIIGVAALRRKRAIVEVKPPSA